MKSDWEEATQRANLAFSNQMEMLTFFLTDGQQYGINVFKIIEVIETPKTITRLPGTVPALIGTINFRDRPVTVIDLAASLGMTGVDYKNSISYIIVCEYNTTIQGLLISSPNKLVNKSWEEIKKPTGAGLDQGCLSALAYDEGIAIQILDVEKVLGEVIGVEDTLSEELIADGRHRLSSASGRILVVDDSRAARALIKVTLERLGARLVMVEDASAALKVLESAAQGPESDRILLVLSDIEMPGVDGFTLTRTIKANPSWSGIGVVLHSSLSNPSNRIKARQVGADDFVAKFQPDVLARLVLDRLGGLGHSPLD